MSYQLYLRYIEVIRKIDKIPIKDQAPLAEELAKRHKEWRVIPKSVYLMHKDRLFRKESLGRPSPYYVDLLSIPNKDDLEVVLRSLHSKMRYGKLTSRRW